VIEMPRSPDDIDAERRAEAAVRYEELSYKTRRWLSGLRDDDIETLNEAIYFQEQAKTIGKFGKWLVLTFVAIVVLMGQFGEGMTRFLTFWLKKG
jgi:hypothetical protein